MNPIYPCIRKGAIIITCLVIAVAASSYAVLWELLIRRLKIEYPGCA